MNNSSRRWHKKKKNQATLTTSLKGHRHKVFSYLKIPTNICYQLKAQQTNCWLWVDAERPNWSKWSARFLWISQQFGSHLNHQIMWYPIRRLSAVGSKLAPHKKIDNGNCRLNKRWWVKTSRISRRIQQKETSHFNQPNRVQLISK